jgi:hypothetical protein
VLYSKKSTAFAAIVATMVCSHACVLAETAIQQQPVQMTLLQQGLRYGAAKRAREAEYCFRQSSVEHPKDPLPHYYLANLLAASKRHVEAIVEYQACYECDPFGVASGYCRKALMSYNAPLPEVAAAEKTVEKKPTMLSAKERLGVSDRPVVASIRTQAEREKNRNRVAGESESSAVFRDTEMKALKIKQAAAENADAILYPPPGSYLQRYNQMHPEEAAQAAKQVRDNADENVKLERLLAEQKASQYKDHFKAREKAVDEVAANLEKQLASKAVPGSARLHEEGTGLFVRYYGSSSDPAPEVHNGVARVVRYVPSPSPQNASDEDSEDDDSTPAVHSTVRGAVLK